jgi:hypothetical protein
MFERGDRSYYEGRADQALRMGDQATDPKVAAVHYELALRYSLLCVRAGQPDKAAPLFGEQRTQAVEFIQAPDSALSAA